MQAFEQLIAPVTVAEFSANNWRKAPMFLQKEDLPDLLTPEEINEFFGGRFFTYPFVKVVSNGGELDHARYALNLSSGFDLLDKQAVLRLFSEGKTIVLQAAHFQFANLNGFVRRLEQEMGMEVQANVYITPAGSQGFDPHFDNHEVFVVQVSGTKTWNLYDVPVQAPIKGMQLPDPLRDHYRSAAPAHQLQLAPGDVLYVPRGVVHDAYTTDEPSVHVTFGFHAMLRLEILGQLLKLAETNPFFREPFYPLPGQAESADRRELLEKATRMLGRLLETPPVYRKHGSKYRDTTDLFGALLLVDGLASAADAAHLGLVPCPSPDHAPDAEEEAFLEKLAGAGSPSGQTVDLDEFKRMTKKLLLRGLVAVQGPAVPAFGIA